MEQDYVFPYTRGYMLPAVALKRQYKWQIEILENLTEILSLLEYKTKGKRIEERKEKYQETEYQIAVKLVSMWQTFIQNVQSEVVKPSRSYIRKQERIQKMLTYIHDNYMNEIHLKEIAEAASVSIGECCRCFQNKVRTTPNQYLMDYRVEKSKKLLVGSQMSVTEIAYAVGFNDSSMQMMALLKSMCSLGIFHVQFNVIDRETLLAAQERPEEYRGLLIRVAGYTAYFTELGKDVQDEIIARTEQESLYGCSVG